MSITTVPTAENQRGRNHSYSMLFSAAENTLNWLEESYVCRELPPSLIDELTDALAYARCHGDNPMTTTATEPHKFKIQRQNMETPACVECGETPNAVIHRGGNSMREQQQQIRLPLQVSGVVASNRTDGQRVVRITVPHPEGGGQDIAEVLEPYAVFIVTACNSFEQMRSALRDEIDAIITWQSACLLNSDLQEGFAISLSKLRAALKAAEGDV